MSIFLKSHHWKPQLRFFFAELALLDTHAVVTCAKDLGVIYDWACGGASSWGHTDGWYHMDSYANWWWVPKRSGATKASICESISGWDMLCYEAFLGTDSAEGPSLSFWIDDTRQ